MTDIVDDLLQEVEMLEETTQQLNETVETVQEQQEVLNNTESSPSVESALIVLEAAKTTQEAAKQSHLAAQSSIKLADQLKVRTNELDELSSNSRQATRSILKDVGTAKNHFTMMMSTTLIINVVALSVLGYFFYENNQKTAQHSEEILDVIQTESMLLNKKITLKMDELASMTESLAGGIQQISLAKTSPQPEVEMQSDMEHSEPAIEHNSMQPKPSVEQSADNIQAFDQLNSQYAELKNLIENMVTSQSLQKTEGSATSPDKANALLVKKLDGLRWLVKKQGVTLNTVKGSLEMQMRNPTPVSAPKPVAQDNGSAKALQEIKLELQILNKQQSEIKLELKTLQDQFAEANKPYSYRYKTD